MKVTENISQALGTAILSLRKRLGLTQLQLSQRLGGFDPEYIRRWERGKVIPSGEIILALLQLCPDEESRALFGLKSPISNPKSATPVRAPAPGDDAELVRYFNDGATGLDILYEAAAAGHPGAKEALRNEADRLVRRATEWRDFKYKKMK